MGDRAKVAGLLKGLFGSDSSISNVSAAVDKAVRIRTHQSATNLNLNVNTNDRVLAVLSTNAFQTNCQVVECGVLPGSASINTSATNFVVVTFWKKDANGANKTTIATFNTGNLTNVNAYQKSAANLEHNAANQTINVGCVGYSVAITGDGSTGMDSGMVYLITRDE